MPAGLRRRAPFPVKCTPRVSRQDAVCCTFALSAQSLGKVKSAVLRAEFRRKLLFRSKHPWATGSGPS
eukprot:5003549-Alexandrium_andersonii.AAC.1